MNEEKIDYINSIYYNPDNPASYSGVDKIHDFIKKDGKFNISKHMIKQWLTSQRIYSAHRAVRRKFKRQRVVVSTKYAQYDGDTVNMTKFSKQNKTFSHFLILIDILSRFTWTVPLTNLTGKSMVTALKSVFAEHKPLTLRTDMGSEFVNKQVKPYLKSIGVKQFTTPNSEVKANYAERCIKTLKSKIVKYMDKKQTHVWYDVLQKMTDSYNNTIHRSIKMTPKQALLTDDPTLWKLQFDPKPKRVKLERKHPPKSKNPYKFKIGDKVKLSYLKIEFSKEYDEKWTDEFFFISRREIKQNIPVYFIKDYNNEEIIGSMYSDELQKINFDVNTVYNIETIIKKRSVRGRKQVLVKWRGWRKQFNTWIDESEVGDIK